MSGFDSLTPNAPIVPPKYLSVTGDGPRAAPPATRLPGPAAGRAPGAGGVRADPAPAPPRRPVREPLRRAGWALLLLARRRPRPATARAGADRPRARRPAREARQSRSAPPRRRMDRGAARALSRGERPD